MNLPEDNNVEPTYGAPKQDRLSTWPPFLAVSLAGFFIGCGILGAGWMIAREFNNQHKIQSQQQEVTTENKRIDIAVPENIPTLGSKDAKVTVIEFADYQCPFCGQWQKKILPLLKSEYIETGKVKFIYWDFAFLGDESIRAAEAARCASEQGKFWEYHDALFASQIGENKGAFSDSRLKNLAGGLKLDSKSFGSCFNNRIHQQLVQDRTQEATLAGVDSTPTVLINGYKLDGVLPWSTYKKLIDAELNQ